MSVKYNLELCFWLFFFCNWFIFLLGNRVSNSVIGTLTLYSATIRAVFEGWVFLVLFLVLKTDSGDCASAKVAHQLLGKAGWGGPTDDTVGSLQPRTNLGGFQRVALGAGIAPDWCNKGDMAPGQS